MPADAETGHRVFETLYGFTAGTFADMLKRASNEYYGTALLAWLEALATRRDEFVTRARKLADEFRAKYARVVGPQVGRVAESFALVVAAGMGLWLPLKALPAGRTARLLTAQPSALRHG